MPSAIRIALPSGWTSDTVAKKSVSGTSVEKANQELAALMSIPAMIGPLTEGMTDESRGEVLDDARERTDPGAIVQVPWLYLVFEKE